MSETHVPPAQRKNLNTLTSSERSELADLIRRYVTPLVLQEHIEWHLGHGSGGTEGISSGEHFLDFHRRFVAKLEDWLMSQGKAQYVPLPYWDPKTPIPIEFSHKNRIENNPNKSLPSWATITGGISHDPLFGHRSLKEFVSSDELGRALGTNFHGSVHIAIGGDMNTHSSPRDPIFFPWHAFLDDIWSKWESIHVHHPHTPAHLHTSKCFIATAAYDSELAPPVQLLREFRDDIILKSRHRKIFEVSLEVYYKFSPPIAEKMKQHKSFKYLMKYLIVWPFVATSQLSVFIIKSTIGKK